MQPPLEIAESTVVYAREIAFALRGVGENQVGVEFKKLADAGLLIQTSPGGGQSRKYFERQPSAYWEMVIHLVDEVTSRDFPRTGQDRPVPQPEGRR